MANYIATGITVDFDTLDAELVDVNYDGEECDVEDVTHQLSPDDYKEKLGSLVDAGQVTVMLHYGGTVPACGTRATLVVTFPASTMTCTAILRKCQGAGATLGKKITSPATFELSGKPVWT